MEACGGVPIYCEIKTEGTEVEDDFLENVYKLIKSYDGQIVVVSFSPFVLKWFRENHPALIRGRLSAGKNHLGENKGAAFALSNLLTNFMAKPDFVSYAFEDKSFGLTLNKFYGTRLVAWTVHSMDDVENAAISGYSTFVGERFDMTEV